MPANWSGRPGKVMHHLRTKFSNFSFLAVEQVLRLGIGLVVMTLIARQLGPDELAAYAYVFSIAAIMAPIGRFGLDAIILRQVAADPADSLWVLSNAIVISITATFVAIALGVLVVALAGGPNGVTVPLMFFAALTILAIPAEIPVLYLKAVERVGLVTFLRTMTAVIAGTAISIAALSGAGLLEFVVLRAAEALAVAAAGALAAVLLTKSGRMAMPNATSIIGYLKTALPLMIASLATLAYMRIDQVMLGQMVAPDQLGKYSVAARIAEVANFLPVVLQSTLYAAIVRNYHSAPNDFNCYMQRIYDVFGLIAWPTMAAIGLLSYFLLVPIFGEEFAGALPMLLILLLGTPLFFLYYAWGTMLTVREWMWAAPAVASFGAVTNIVLNLVLIPEFGGAGAAVATVISYGVASIGGSLIIGKLRPSAISMVFALNPIQSSRRLVKIYGKPWRISFGKENPSMNEANE